MGKTTDLMKISAENNYYIVCSLRREADRMFHDAREIWGLDIPLPITFDEFIKGEYYGKGIKGFLVDNAELLIQRMSRVPVFAITVSTKQSENNCPICGAKQGESHSCILENMEVTTDDTYDVFAEAEKNRSDWARHVYQDQTSKYKS